MSRPRRQTRSGRARGRLAGLAVLLSCPAMAAAAGRPPWLDPENWAWWLLGGSLAALAVVLVILRAVGYRRMGRLWQGVVASVLAHMALTAGLSLVAISQPVLSLLARSSSEEPSVTLVVGHEARLRQEIRTQVTEVPVADPSLAALMRASLESIRSPEFRTTDLPAPLAEPRRAELAEQPETPVIAPPPVEERLRLRPPGSETPEPTVAVTPYLRVVRTEERAAADADRPVPAAPADTRPPELTVAWPPPPAPKAELDARSIVEAASREVAPLPEPAEQALRLPEPPDTPELEVPQAAAPVRAEEERPAPARAAPAPSFARRDAQAGRADSPALPPADTPPPAAVPPDSVAVAAPRPAPAPARPEDVPHPRPVPEPTAMGPTAVPSAAPVREGEQPIGAPAGAPAPLMRQPTGPPAARSSLASLPSPQRVAPADARGAALTAHLAARPAPKAAAEWELERPRFATGFTPLGALALHKIQVDKPIRHRTPAAKAELVARMGGTKISEAAVQRALAYLARNAEPDGRWTYLDEDADTPGKRPPNKDDTGLTGLVLLAFLADGDRPDEGGKFQQPVAAGLAFLLDSQKADGDLRGRGDMYSHGIAALALGEAAAMTGNARYGGAAIDAARFILRAQNRQSGGWRYTPGDVGDTSVLGWQIMALYSVGRLRDFDIPTETRALALRWLASVGRGKHAMLTGYQTARPTRAMTAEGLFVRALLGQQLTPAQLAEATDYLTPPDAVSLPNLYEWYYGSLALMQTQSPAWRRWNPVIRDRLTGMQHEGGDLDGSWDPANTAWGAERGGRIYATALAALSLEVYYRYLPMFEGTGSPVPLRPD
ncbi:MAG TPA: hypothetical protein VM695_08910 [Phycisphaerae bacterium]|nr:hypothetical protein [Phycisphaerae bacterium]